MTKKHERKIDSNGGVVAENSSGQFSVQFTPSGGKERFLGKFHDRFKAEEALATAIALGHAEKAEAAKSVNDGTDDNLEDSDENITEAVSEALRTLVSHVVFVVSSPSLSLTLNRPPGADQGLLRLCRFGVNCKRTDAAHWAEADHPLEHPRMGSLADLPPQFSLSSLPDCRHWTHKGCCGLGSSCRYTHSTRKRALHLVPNHRERTNTATGNWRQRGRRNNSRGTVFRRFLIDTFGFEVLKRGSGVLDVAGGGSGGGGLAFSLLNYSGVPATVVDPRPPVTKRAIDTLLFAGNSGGCSAQEVASSGIGGLVTGSGGSGCGGGGGGDGSGGGGSGIVVRPRYRAKNPLTAKYDTDVTPRGTPPRLPRYVLSLCEDAFDAAEALGGGGGDGGAASGQGGGDDLAHGTLSDAERGSGARGGGAETRVEAGVETRSEGGTEAGAESGSNPGSEGGSQDSSLVVSSSGSGPSAASSVSSGKVEANTKGRQEVEDALGASAHTLREARPPGDPTKSSGSNNTRAAAEGSRRQKNGNSSTEEGAPNGGDNHDDDEDTLQVRSGAEVGRVVRDCSVVCGLHPDAATEPLVDFALRTGKPFAVVPCCVFWRSRVGLLEAGVRSYEDFLRHLESKRPPGEIQRSTLAFDGRNTVLWWPGPSSSPADSASLASQDNIKPLESAAILLRLTPIVREPPEGEA